MANSRSITSIGPRIVAVVDGESESVIQQSRSFRKAKVARVTCDLNLMIWGMTAGLSFMASS
jgi:hypothetical protein